jgi:uncharacterized RDD family membrane protein YckC
MSVEQRTTRFLDPFGRRQREIVTPEGVILHVECAQYGERITAFLLDFVFLLTMNLVLILIPVATLSAAVRAQAMAAIVGLIAFLIRSLYFVYFELAWRGMTPGKRIVGLRVINRSGGPLRASSVAARNLMRELECFMPLQAVLAIGVAEPGRWERIALTLWLVLLAILPLCNRDRLRIGDLLAGTMVIATPKRRLLPDLVEAGVDQSFTDAQLRAYGAFELQVLEEVLRQAVNELTAQLQRDVCERVRRKIGWATPVPPVEAAAFLSRFYAAQRAFLERERLYGRRREDKTGKLDSMT